VATGKPHTIREFVQAAFEELGMAITWQGKGIGERAIANATGKTVVEVSEQYFRPTDVTSLTGDPAQTEKQIGWKAQTTFRDLVKLMVKADWESVAGR
jgi:GDPmannose 4,6-dehydratase